jgi:MSHA biogenesis protein MshO
VPGTAGQANGTLQRTVRGIGSKDACPLSATAPQIVAARVTDCSFVYRENEGATQQSGYLQLRLGMSDGGEAVTLTMGAHVENLP